MIARYHRVVDVPRGEVALTRAVAFEAAHAYRSERFGAARRLHGHNYVVTAAITGPVDARTHFLVDFRQLDELLRELVRSLDHQRIDAVVEPLEPCVEALAVVLRRDLVDRVRSAIPRARLCALRVAETDDLWAQHEGGPAVELTRAYGFSAAHRLADGARGAEENARLYGKDMSAHGHDYRLEITVAGEPDARTGTVADLASLDAHVRDRVLERFDHQDLNTVAPFDRLVPTAERICEEIWRVLELPSLVRIVLYETPRSAFTYTGPA